MKSSIFAHMKIANIVSETKINLGPEFINVQKFSDIVPNDLPTLIIGYNNVCDIFGEDNLNILNREISENIFWTFRRNEKRVIYDADVEMFIRHSYKNFTKKINYVDLDLIQFSKFKIRKIVKKLLSLKDVITYKSDNNVFYIYSENIIFGIDMNLVEFVGFDTSKVLDKIKSKSMVFLEGNEILIEYNNQLDRFNNDVKLIPVLYSINPYE